jgi:hypothetical protein
MGAFSQQTTSMSRRKIQLLRTLSPKSLLQLPVMSITPSTQPATRSQRGNRKHMPNAAESFDELRTISGTTLRNSPKSKAGIRANR